MAETIRASTPPRTLLSATAILVVCLGLPRALAAQGPVFSFTPGAVIHTTAGNGAMFFSGDNGPATAAALAGPNAIATDSAGNTTRVVSSRLNWQKPNVPILTVTAESVSFDTPPSEFAVAIVELNPAIEKHPRYAFLTLDIRNLINMSVSGSQLISVNEAQKQLQTSLDAILKPKPPPNPPPQFIGTNKQIRDAAMEVLTKRRLGEDTFYLPGFRLTWAEYFWSPVALNPGGYIGDPIDEGLPWFFWSVDYTPEGSDIFHLMAEWNPQFYTLPNDADPDNYRDGISWLRMCDTIEYSRTWFKITHSWLGAPYAHWDADLYSQKASPYPPPPPFPLSGAGP